MTAALGTDHSVGGRVRGTINEGTKIIAHHQAPPSRLSKIRRLGKTPIDVLRVYPPEHLGRTFLNSWGASHRVMLVLVLIHLLVVVVATSDTVRLRHDWSGFVEIHQTARLLDSVIQQFTSNSEKLDSDGFLNKQIRHPYILLSHVGGPLPRRDPVPRTYTAIENVSQTAKSGFLIFFLKKG